MRFKFLSIAVLMLAAATGQVQAGVILSPIAASSTLGQFNSAFPITSLIDRTGLSSTFTSGTTDFGTFMASGATHSMFPAFGTWASTDGIRIGTMDFDLGAVYTVSQLALWDVYANRSINSFSVITSELSNFSIFSNVGSFVNHSANQATPAEVFNLVDSTARYVRLTIASNWGSTLTQEGEIAFDVSAASAVVPEPAYLAMWGLGAVGMMFARRRHQQKKLTA